MQIESFFCINRIEKCWKNFWPWIWRIRENIATYLLANNNLPKNLSVRSVVLVFFAEPFPQTLIKSFALVFSFTQKFSSNGKLKHNFILSFHRASEYVWSLLCACNTRNQYINNSILLVILMIYRMKMHFATHIECFMYGFDAYA